MVDVPAMAHHDNQDEQDLVLDLVDDPVVAGAQSPLALACDQLLGATGPRLLTEQLDGGLHPAACGGIELAQLTPPLLSGEFSVQFQA